MATFTWTARGNQGVQYDGTYPPKYQQLLNNSYAGNFYVISDTLLSNGGLTIYVTPGFELDYEYKNFNYNSYSETLSYSGVDFIAKEYGNLVATGKSEGYIYQRVGSNNAAGYFSKITGYSYETNIYSEIIGTIDASGVGSSVYQNYLHYTSGNDTFNGTSKGDILNSGTGNDVIYGNGGDDTLYGGNGNDGIQGNDGNDKIFGGNGSDSITPGKGNDEVDGGSGSDEVWFSGDFSNYFFTGSSKNLKVTDINSGSNDGIDTLKNIEFLRFKNKKLTPTEALSTNTSSSSNYATSTELQQLYIAYFSRPSDPTGLDYWTEKGISRSAFAANMYLQPEFNNVNGGLSVEAQVNQLYLNLFNRDADITGLIYWTQQINLGNLQLASIANDLIWAAENNPGGSSDSLTLGNKTNAAVAYTAKIRTSTSSILNYQAQSTNPWITGNNLTEAKSFISEIGQYNTHSSWSIENSISKFISLSTLSSYKLLIDPIQSNKDIITGIETDVDPDHTYAVNEEKITSYSLKEINNYPLLDINHLESVSQSYEEVLGREADYVGMNYGLGQLNSGAETRYEFLLGFSESGENKALFNEISGLF